MSPAAPDSTMSSIGETFLHSDSPNTTAKMIKLKTENEISNRVTVPDGVGEKAVGMSDSAAAAMSPITVSRSTLKMVSNGAWSLCLSSQRPTMRMSVNGRMRTANEAMTAPSAAIHSG